MSQSLLDKVQLRIRRRFPSRKARRHELVGPAHFWKQKREFQIAFLTQQGLSTDDTLVDIGCGTLRGGVPIIDLLAAGHYAGVDIRAEIESEARAELAEHHLEQKAPTLVFGKPLPDIHLERRFDFAWAFAVFFHLTDEHLAECFAFVAEHLAPNGVFYANANVGEHEPDEWREFPVVWRKLDRYAEFAAAAGLATDDLGTLGSLGHDFVSPGQRMLKFTFRP